MWHTSFNNNTRSYGGSQEREADIGIMLQSLQERAEMRAERWNLTPEESLENDTIYQQTPTYTQQEQEYLQPLENYYEEMNYVGKYEYQHEQFNYEPYGDPFQSYYEEMDYAGNPEYQYEPYNPDVSYYEPSFKDHEGNDDLDINSMLRQILEGQMREEEERKRVFVELDNKVDGISKELNDKLEGLASHMETLSNQVAQVSNEEEIEEISQLVYGFDVEDVALEGEACYVFPTNFEVVVEHQEEFAYTQQQNICDEEVEEIIHLPEVELIEDALALIEEALIEETLLYYEASTIDTKNKEEEEVVQLYELPKKMFHEDEAVEQRVPGSPTPRSRKLNGLREKLEWKIKHRRRIKPLNV